MDPITSSGVFRCHGLGSQLDSARRNCSKSLTIIVSPFCLARKTSTFLSGSVNVTAFASIPRCQDASCLVCGFGPLSLVDQPRWQVVDVCVCPRCCPSPIPKGNIQSQLAFSILNAPKWMATWLPPFGSCSYLPKKYQCVFSHIHCWFKIESPWWGNMDSATLLPQQWIVGVIPCG